MGSFKQEVKMVKEFFKMNKKVIALIGVIAGIFLSLLAVKTMEYTDSPGFCKTCHNMESEYQTFTASTHSELSCNNCHLPNDNIVRHLFFKGRAGMTHVYYNTFATSKIPNVIHASDRTKEVINENCISCHKSTLTNVSHNAKDDCTSCHRFVPHGKGFKTKQFNEQPQTGELLKNKGGY
jgi:cytochrome c nitrite reductase small subunit